ncbi:MAG TPA: 3-hydroxyacyl-CoA dehydrogenase NAD-binding domain-containing protein [Actinomycetales bacterium]|jgi:3-hydroxyacyl-CoA dehydrogenase/enoyl-CoA hydratase/carnithine racemase
MTTTTNPAASSATSTATTTAAAAEQLAAATTDERVTSFPVRDVVLPGGAGTLALITMDNGFDHTKPTTFGPRGLLNLRDTLDVVTRRAEAGEIVAVAVTGKPFIFAVGADLKDVGRVADREQALAVARLGHDQLRRLGELPVPSFAFVNGAAMGGGVEIALHCTYRTISSGVPALALPEVFLGLLPGWGGAYLLPRLVGIEGALKVIIENAMSQNRMLKGPQAHALGIADVMLEPADFLTESLRWAAGVVTGSIPVQRKDVDLDEQVWTAAIAKAKAFADSKVGGAAPAAYRALEVVALARTVDRDAGFAAEDEALADLIMSEEFRAGVYSFDLVQRRAKRPAGAPDKALARPVTKVGIVGAGLMASQLALLFAQRLQVPVVLTDLDAERVDKGVAYVRDQVAGQLRKGRMSRDKANRITALVSGSTSKDGFADADFVIEAVFERMDVKQQVFAEVEQIVSPECVLATNTSSLSVTEMASTLRHPERLVGFHFFNPVAVLPLLEIVRAEQTDDATLASAFAVGAALKKSCVLVKDAPAFVVNRLLTRFLGEVTHAVDTGTPVEVADRALAGLGLPMSPFVLLQLVGPAVALHVAETLHERFPDRYHVSENLRRLVAAGKPGIYFWTDRGTPYVDDETAALLQLGDAPMTADELRDVALAALAQEARLMLDEGVVAAPQDLDLCMILGAGWPFHLGGITPYLDRAGVSESVTGQRFLPRGAAGLPG